MGNPNLSRAAFPPNDRVAPPQAPPAQLGEVRHCLNCIRCQEVVQRIGGMHAVCTWQGRWDWPEKGCDRWELNPEPRASLLPTPSKPPEPPDRRKARRWR